MEHKDNKGNKGLLGPGSIQWMTAGSGIVHSEMPKQEDGLMHGFQMWINLPSHLKMMQPRYQDIEQKDIPTIVSEDGSKVRIMAGEYKNQTGPVKGIVTNPTYLDVTLSPGASFTEQIPIGHTTFVYVYEGSGYFGPQDNQKQVSITQLGIFSAEDSQTKVDIVAGTEGVKFLLAAAAPINEPIARYGPFVMNTQEEIDQAFDDYYNNRF